MLVTDLTVGDDFARLRRISSMFVINIGIVSRRIEA